MINNCDEKVFYHNLRQAIFFSFGRMISERREMYMMARATDRERMLCLAGGQLSSDEHVIIDDDVA